MPDDASLVLAGADDSKQDDNQAGACVSSLAYILPICI